MVAVHGLHRAAVVTRSRHPEPFTGSGRCYIPPVETLGHSPMLGVAVIRPGVMVNCLATSSGLKPVVVRKLVHGAVTSAVNRIDEKEPVIPVVEYMVGTNLIFVMHDNNRVKVV